MARIHTLFALSMVVLTACSSSPRPRHDIITPAKPRAVQVAIDTATSHLGAPYRYGGTTRDGFDCSGLAYVSFDAAGVALPRTSRDQSTVGQSVPRHELRPGDLVFFDANRRSRIDHVGIVSDVGGGRMIFIHATTRSGVRTDRLDAGYWSERYVSARRVALR